MCDRKERLLLNFNKNTKGKKKVWDVNNLLIESLTDKLTSNL